MPYRVFLLNIEIKEVNIVIYDKIKKICTERKISVTSVEKEAGLSNGAISKWGDKMPLADNLYSVARVLNVTVEELLEKSEG